MVIQNFFLDDQFLYLTHSLVPLASISLIWLYIEQPCPVPFILALLYCSWLILTSCALPNPGLYPSVRYALPCAIRYHALFVVCTAIRCVLLPSNLGHSYSIKPALLFFLQACHDSYSKPALLALVSSIFADFGLYWPVWFPILTLY